MSQHTVNATVPIKPADALFPSWATSINASGLFREAVAEQMMYRDIDRDELSTLTEETLTETSRGPRQPPRTDLQYRGLGHPARNGSQLRLTDTPPDEQSTL